MRERYETVWIHGRLQEEDILNLVTTLGFPGSSAVKESACNTGDLGSIPGLGRYPGEGNVYPLQYSGLENSMDCIVHGVANSDFHFHMTILMCCIFL